MHTSHASTATRFKVGLFTVFGLALVGAITVFVNDRPFWWRPCELVNISIDDATGLKTKSPVRSLGLQIGYLRSVELSETHVRLGICITAPVEVLPATRAYIRGEGFLGDKFVELKPVKYTGGGERTPPPATLPPPIVEPSPPTSTSWLERAYHLMVPSAYAGPTPATKKNGREIPVGEKSQDVEKLVNQVDGLVEEMTNLTKELKSAIDPREMRATLNQLNKTLENASRTLSPEGNLNTTAQRTLAKLEDSIEQLRDMMTRVNKGEGSIGMLINDPTYAEEIREAVRNVNRLLSKVGGVRFVVDIGAVQIPALDGGRGWFRLGIWPAHDRYYLLGITLDPRGKRNVTTTTTVTNGGAPSVVTETQVDQGGVLITGMLGKVFWNRLDLSLGSLHGDGTISVGLRLGPFDREEMFVFRNDIYSHGQGLGIEDRATVTLRPFVNRGVLSNVYLTGGLESFKKVNGKTAWEYGAGISFDDDDIKLLFALR